MGQLVSDETLCSSVHSYTDLNSALRCVKNEGDTISFTDLSPVIILDVTFRFKSGRTVKKKIDLKKIGKSQLQAQTQGQCFLETSWCSRTSGVLAMIGCTDYKTQLQCYKQGPIVAFPSRYSVVLQDADLLWFLCWSVTVVSLQSNPEVLRCGTSPSTWSLTRLLSMLGRLIAMITWQQRNSFSSCISGLRPTAW